MGRIANWEDFEIGIGALWGFLKSLLGRRVGNGVLILISGGCDDGRQELMFGVFALFADDHDEEHRVVFRIRYTRSTSTRRALLLGEVRPARESACA